MVAWKIVNENSSKALYVRSREEGIRIEQQILQQELNEFWELLPISPVGSGRFKIRSLATDKVLAIPNPLLGKQEVPVVQQSDGDNPGQEWSFHLVGIGPYLELDFIYFVFRINNAISQLALDVRGASTEDGAVIQQYAANGTPAQRWRLVPA